MTPFLLSMDQMPSPTTLGPSLLTWLSTPPQDTTKNPPKKVATNRPNKKHPPQKKTTNPKIPKKKNASPRWGEAGVFCLFVCLFCFVLTVKKWELQPGCKVLGDEKSQLLKKRRNDCLENKRKGGKETVRDFCPFNGLTLKIWVFPKIMVPPNHPF